uniref:Uncharacterized protein n=1 Tax=Kalanchoe fedtschenkoi TaxID=63787 RepID=A0A7N0ZVD9_KALFE
MCIKSLTIHCLHALQEPPRFPQLPSTAFISQAPSQRSLHTPSSPHPRHKPAICMRSAQRGSNLLKSAVMGRFWTWVLLILVVAVHAHVQKLALPQMVSASTPPIRRPSPLAGTGTPFPLPVIFQACETFMLRFEYEHACVWRMQAPEQPSHPRPGNSRYSKLTPPEHILAKNLKHSLNSDQQQTTTQDDPRLSLEDYKPVDPSPDSGTSKVKSSPIEHGELLNPYITPKPPSSDIDHEQPSPAPSLTKTLKN